MAELVASVRCLLERPEGTRRIGAIGGPGLRCYLAVRGGFDVPSYLGSASTFTLGRFGGHSGRALAAGDVLRARDDSRAATPARTPQDRRPAIVTDWPCPGVTA